MKKKKNRKKGIVYVHTDRENALIDISEKEAEKLPDISPGQIILPENERITIARFDGDKNLVPENDVIFLTHESNDMTDIDPVKFHIATNRRKDKVDLKKLKELSVDKDANIRAAIARNCFIDGNTLHRLAQDKNKYVRESVASNSYGNLQERTMRLLMRDKDMYIRNTLSSNQTLTLEVMKKMLLIEKKDIFVMCNLIEQINKQSKKI